jgi:hypothetical protein
MSGDPSSHVESILRQLEANDPTFLRLNILHAQAGWITDSCIWRRLCSGISQSTVLRELRCENVSLDCDAMRLMQQAVARNSSLTKVKILSCILADGCIELLADALPGHLTVNYVDVGRSEMSSSGIQRLCGALERCPALRHLNLNEHSCVVDVFPAVVSLLQASSTLFKLKLPGCKLTAKELQHLTNCIEISTLVELVLTFNGEISDDGACELAQLLCKKSKLQVLNVASCNIGAVGCTAIARALHTQGTLLSLSLWHNPLGAGAGALAEMLRCNVTLLRLYIKDCHINGLAGEAIAQAVNVNLSIVQLDVTDNMVAEQDTNIIDASLKRNAAAARARELAEHVASASDRHEVPFADQQAPVSSASASCMPAASAPSNSSSCSPDPPPPYESISEAASGMLHLRQFFKELGLFPGPALSKMLSSLAEEGVDSLEMLWELDDSDLKTALGLGPGSKIVNFRKARGGFGVCPVPLLSDIAKIH